MAEALRFLAVPTLGTQEAKKAVVDHQLQYQRAIFLAPATNDISYGSHRTFRDFYVLRRTPVRLWLRDMVRAATMPVETGGQMLSRSCKLKEYCRLVSRRCATGKVVINPSNRALTFISLYPIVAPLIMRHVANALFSIRNWPLELLGIVAFLTAVGTSLNQSIIHTFQSQDI